MKIIKNLAKHDNLSEAALKAFFNICLKWKLNNEQKRILLGSPAERTFYEWQKKGWGNLDQDKLERISYILGIYKALQILFPSYEAADAWVKKPNAAPLFNGNSALDRMLSGNVADLYVVRQYLDSVRGE